MEYLSLEQIVLIHATVIEETGGAHGIRDLHLLESAAEMPKQFVFGKELYNTVFLKAATYIRSLAMNHAFIDGNKRTAAVTAITFLEINQHYLNLREGVLADFILRVIEKHLEPAQIALWLKKHSKKI